MKSVFRVYARTSKGNDQYLYQQLLNFGIKPKYQQLFHSFYFNATFSNIFKLSFNSLTVENMYVQLGQKYYLPSVTVSGYRTNQTRMTQFFENIQFNNFINLQKNKIQDIVLKVFVRQSSRNLPSQQVIASLLQNQLKKKIIMKQYKLMLTEDQRKKNMLLNYYDIKGIIQRKWQQQALQKQQNLAISNQQKYLDNSQIKNTLQKNSSIIKSNQVSLYNPHFVLYFRRNHARLLLKINKKQLYKHGWKKNVGWGPIRQTLIASILYRSGLIKQAKKNKQLKLWDPFCGSGTIPLVASSMFANINVRQDNLMNFTWPHWNIYRKSYLDEFLQSQKKEQKLRFKIIGSDIDLKTVNNSIGNFRKMLEQYSIQDNVEKYFIKDVININMMQVVNKQVYFGCGDFQNIGQSILKQIQKNEQKINIVTNLPYLNQRSKEKYQNNQLRSIYKRFNKMIGKYKNCIQNVFIIVGTSQQKNYSHFLNVSTQQWRLLAKFDNGGIQVGLYGWVQNLINQIHQINTTNYDTNSNTISKFSQEKSKYLQSYRQKIKSIDSKEYYLPKHIANMKGKRGFKRVLAKRKARHLRAAYTIFSKRRDKNQAFKQYSRKQLALKLTRRGISWKRKNIGIVGQNIEDKQKILKKQFQERIKKALKKSEQKKQEKLSKKKGSKEVKRKW